MFLFLPFEWLGVAQHKLLGLLALGFLALRFLLNSSGYRVRYSQHGKIESAAAIIVRRFITFSFVALPTGGLLLHAVSGPGVAIAGMSEDFLKFMAPSPFLARWLITFHIVVSTLLLVALFLHLVGALKHHFYDGDATLARMITAKVSVTRARKSRLVSGRDAPSFSTHILGMALLVFFLTSGIHFRAETHRPLLHGVEGGVSSPVDCWESIPLSSQIQVYGRHHGRAFEAQFANFLMQLDMNSAGEPTSVGIKIDSSSFTSDLIRRDTQVSEAKWLHSELYPEILYVAHDFRRISERQWVADGVLMVKQFTVSQSVEFDLAKTENNEAYIKGSVLLDRFKVGIGVAESASLSIADRGVEIGFQIYALKKEPLRNGLVDARVRPVASTLSY